MDREQRATKRVRLVTEVKYEGSGTRAQTRISDIGMLGVFIDALSPLPAGSSIRVEFSLPNGYRVDTEGTVVHSQAVIGMGVAFKSLSPEDAWQIQAYIDSM